MAFHWPAWWHIIVSRRKVPWNTAIVVHFSAVVGEAFHPAILHRVGLEQAQFKLVLERFISLDFIFRFPVFLLPNVCYLLGYLVKALSCRYGE